MTAALPPQPQKKLQPIPPPSKTWRHIGMDLICDLPESEEGYKHILVTVCYLSKTKTRLRLHKKLFRI